MVLGLAGLIVAAVAGAPPENPETRWRSFSFRHDHVLGTSLDLSVVVADPETARAVEETVLQEVDRLGRILTGHAPEGDLWRLNRSRDWLRVAPEVVEVLELCETWRLRTGGAFNARVGSLTDLWKEAEREDRLPASRTRDDLRKEMAGPAAEVDGPSGRARRRGGLHLSIDGLAKGYILERALERVGERHPGLPGILLDIGGDIAVRGCAEDGGAWVIGVADPSAPYDNGAPLAAVEVDRGAIATSGSDARHFRIGGRKYSHILDPRSGRPASGVMGATVIAPDGATADALATAMMVLGPAEGIRLLESMQDVEGLIVDAEGRRHASSGWAPRAVPARAAPAWPDGSVVRITFTLNKKPPGKKYKRPYLAVWIEDAGGKRVRTVAVWGKKDKYLKTLTSWWEEAPRDKNTLKAITRSTRAGGDYTLVWDGRDDKGNAMPEGTYTIRMDVHREHGKHYKDMAGKIECGKDGAKGEIRGNVEITKVTLVYGPEER